MKIVFLSLFILFAFVASGQNDRSFRSLDSKVVISRLFDNVNYSNNQEALWEPNFSEKLNMPVSDDGFCHTRMDTTMFYTSGEVKQAVIIFATYEYRNGVKVSCHVCAPMLSIATFSKEENGSWKILQFKKDFIGMGAWGEKLGRLGIERLGVDFYCLKVKSAVYGNQGYERGTCNYYSLNWYEQFREVFSYVYYDSNEGAVEEGKGFTEETTIKIHQTDNEFFGIELISKRKDRKTPVLKKYRYSEDENRYLLIN